MPTEQKLARAALGYASEACRRGCLCRSQAYEFGRRFPTPGLEGLKDLLAVPTSHCMAAPPEVVGKLLKLSLEHAAWGKERLSTILKLKRIYVSGPTARDFLTEHSMMTRFYQWLKLEEKSTGDAIDLTGEQIDL